MRLFLGSTSGSRHSPRLDFIGLTVWLFGWFCSLTLAEADARPAAVLVNEVYTGQFQGTPNRLAGLAIKRKPSVDFSGYWQRHSEASILCH
jgi:hypothetical protein